MEKGLHYEGRVFAIRNGKSWCKFDLGDYPKLFPNFNIERDVIFNKDETHLITLNNPALLTKEIN